MSEDIEHSGPKPEETAGAAKQEGQQTTGEKSAKEQLEDFKKEPITRVSETGNLEWRGIHFDKPEGASAMEILDEKIKDAEEKAGVAKQEGQQATGEKSQKEQYEDFKKEPITRVSETGNLEWRGIHFDKPESLSASEILDEKIKDAEEKANSAEDQGGNVEDPGKEDK